MTMIVAGLGNPGPKYEATRHNIGFLVADALAARNNARWATHKATKSDVVELRLNGENVVVMKPRTYMNLSGQSVGGLAKYLKLSPGQIVAIHDDLDLDFGAIRLKLGGGEGGHNGLRSLTSHLNTRDYLRVRVGIGRPPGRMDVASYVLKPFSKIERDTLGVIVEEAADAVELLLELGLEAAQNRVHAR
ncbi:aminoacyl-tRNA hydrolase [Hoyosella rhizosphaerae]|uniref:Peptidyl-tRNA hydrolase n=1 Tax=Hoyosella rhizosphaerae TaxID=1755582 RepID=A0A916XGA1_9ACTN|nr:aminoacyl-tRNA hydrolase [Hoyosella rhizosphaerae]MBN4925729.1 aminoacyl-tRNA hydrolase [Hoyosella rhizosphaerae]GGC68403.1 peptidyl-tRNA hydrolase [Hoyosella rhizosphaerae]